MKLIMCLGLLALSTSAFAYPLKVISVVCTEPTMIESHRTISVSSPADYPVLRMSDVYLGEVQNFFDFDVDKLEVVKGNLVIEAREVTMIESYRVLKLKINLNSQTTKGTITPYYINEVNGKAERLNDWSCVVKGL